MMLSEDEPPPTPQEKLFIRHAIAECRDSLQADKITKAIMEPILDRLLKSVKKDVNEVTIKPEDDWVVKNEAAYKSKSSDLTIPSSQYQDVVEKVLFKNKWHFEFHETGTAPKYVVFFKCFGETFGKRPELIEKMTFDANGVLVPAAAPAVISPKDSRRKKPAADKATTEKDKSSDKKKEKSRKHKDRQSALGAPPERNRRELRRKESNLSNSSSSRN